MNPTPNGDELLPAQTREKMREFVDAVIQWDRQDNNTWLGTTERDMLIDTHFADFTRTPTAPAKKEGTVRVLREPTPDIINGVWDKFNDSYGAIIGYGAFEFIYKAMIAAQESSSEGGG